MPTGNERAYEAMSDEELFELLRLRDTRPQAELREPEKPPPGAEGTTFFNSPFPNLPLLPGLGGASGALGALGITPDDVTTGVRNSPQALGKQGKGLLELLGLGAQLPFSEEARGVAGEAIRSLPGQMVEGVESFFSDPQMAARKSVRENLPGVVMDAAGVASLPESALGKLGMGLIRKARGHGAKGKILAPIAERMIRRGPVLRDVQKMSREGGKEIAEFDRIQKMGRGEEALMLEGLAGTVKQGVLDIRQRSGSKFNQAMKQIADGPAKGVSLDLAGVKRDLEPILEEFRAGLKGGEVQFGKNIQTNRQGIQDAVEMVMSETRDDFLSLREVYEGLDELAGEHQLIGNSRASAVIGQIRDRVRGELRKIPEYQEATRVFQEERSKLSEIAASLSTESKGSETTLTKLIQIYSERDLAGYRANLVEELERVTGHPIKAQIAAMATKQWFPRWTAFLQNTAGGGSMAAGAYLVNPWIALGPAAMIPMGSPKLMGKLFRRMGARQKLADEFEGFASVAHNLATKRGIAIEGMTLGAIVRRLVSSGEDEQLEPLNAPGLSGLGNFSATSVP